MKILLYTIITLCLFVPYTYAADTTAELDLDGNLVVTVTVSPNEQQFLKNDLLSIQEWLEGAIVGKTHKCKSRMVKEWDEKLRNDKSVTSIPTDETQWLSLVTSRDDYKSRPQKEVDAIQERIAIIDGQIADIDTEISGAGKETDTSKLKAKKSSLESYKSMLLTDIDNINNSK